MDITHGDTNGNEPRRIVVVGDMHAGINKHELMELLGKHIIIEPGFSPAHAVAYDQEKMREMAEKFKAAPPQPKVDNCKTMRNFVRSHSRRGRR